MRPRLTTSFPILVIVQFDHTGIMVEFVCTIMRDGGCTLENRGLIRGTMEANNHGTRIETSFSTMYIAEYMYFYFPYIAFAQCACVGASTLFSVINEIPSRINFGANEAVFTHSFTDKWKIFAFVHANI